MVILFQAKNRYETICLNIHSKAVKKRKLGQLGQTYGDAIFLTFGTWTFFLRDWSTWSNWELWSDFLEPKLSTLELIVLVQMWFWNSFGFPSCASKMSRGCVSIGMVSRKKVIVSTPWDGQNNAKASKSDFQMTFEQTLLVVYLTDFPFVSRCMQMSWREFYIDGFFAKV